MSKTRQDHTLTRSYSWRKTVAELYYTKPSAHLVHRLQLRIDRKHPLSIDIFVDDERLATVFPDRKCNRSEAQFNLELLPADWTQHSPGSFELIKGGETDENK